jgi:DNA-binding response OmpR family regulator
MPRILLVADHVGAFEELAPSLGREAGAQILWAHDGAAALRRVDDDRPDLVIVDEFIGETSGLDWIRQLIAINAFIQTAVVSRLPREAFHEAAEGLGVMTPLPPRPGENEARPLVEALRRMPESN